MFVTYFEFRHMTKGTKRLRIDIHLIIERNDRTWNFFLDTANFRCLQIQFYQKFSVKYQNFKRLGTFANV